MRRYLNTLHARLFLGALIPAFLFAATAVVALLTISDLESVAESGIEAPQGAAHAAAVHGAAVRGLWLVGLTCVGSVVLCILLPLRLNHTLTAPLRQLGAAAEQLRHGAYTPLTPAGPTEVAQLASYFNMMGLALSERDTLARTVERRYQGLIGSFSSLLWITDAQGAFGGDSAGWLAYTGLTQADLESDGWLRAVHPDDHQRVRSAWEEALVARSAFDATCRLRRHDDVYRMFSCRCVPIFRNQDLLEWVCACTDITERQQQETLRRDKEAAEAANRAKSEFLTRMSHELRTPLNAIIGMSKMLKTRRFGDLTDKQAEYVADISKAGEYLLSLINAVLDITNVEAGHTDLTLEAVSLNATIHGLLALVQPLAAAKGQDLIGRPPEEDGEIVTDLARLKQVFLNLLSNAIKFTPSGKPITVRAAWIREADRHSATCGAGQAQAVRFDVEDAGIGIPAGEEDKVWEEFHQATNCPATTEGAGLGLALVRRLVRLLGGVIWLRSGPNAGSCFRFVLPRRAPRTDNPSSPPA